MNFQVSGVVVVLLGSICMSASIAQTNAKERGLSLVSEAKDLVYRIGDLEYSGRASYTPDAADCRKAKVESEIIIKYSDTPHFVPTDITILYFPGVEHHFSGRTCFPTQQARVGREEYLLFETKDVPQAARVIPDGNLSSKTFGEMLARNGNVRIRGSANFSVNAESPVFEITAEGDQPFVLRLTDEGYKYVSGKGTVKSPNGKSYRFP